MRAGSQEWTIRRPAKNRCASGDGLSFDRPSCWICSEKIAIVHRIAGAPDAAGTNMPFRDVPAGAYYAQPVLWSYHAGVVNGCGADTFCPTQAISRQDLTVILYRYACLAGVADAAQSENVLSGFADADAVSDYARAALAWAVENGIVYGRNDHRIDPRGTATRAECAALLWRFVSQYSLA